MAEQESIGRQFFEAQDRLRGGPDPALCTVDYTADVNGNHQWDADQGVDSPGTGNEIVQYKVDYDWNILTPIMRQFLGKDGKLPMSATVVVQNEPCPVGSTCTSGAGGWQN